MISLTQVPVYQIPLTQIAVIDRARKDMGNLADLANDILTNGQITPGVVRRAVLDDQTDGVDCLATPYVLVAGGRRYAACFAAGMESFKAELKEDMPPLQQRIIELHENLHRKDLLPDEEVFLKEEIHGMLSSAALMEGKVWTIEDTAKELGESKGNISKDLTLAKEMRANPELRSHATKASALRAVNYDKAIQERLGRVNQTSLLRVKDRLHVADMRDFARRLPTHSIDLCFTDFPFGIDYWNAVGTQDRNHYEDKPEQLKDLLTDVIPQILRITKPTGWLALMMGSTHYMDLKALVETCCVTHHEYVSLHPWIREGPDACRYVRAEDPEWIWYRPNSRNPSMHPEIHAQNAYEKLCIVNMGEAVLTDKTKQNVLVYDQVYTDRIHEMQRPHGLCLDIVSRFTVGGEVVLDLCFGSGSALAAAAELQRDFLGCDLNPANLEPALTWVTEHLNIPHGGNNGGVA